MGSLSALDSDYLHKGAERSSNTSDLNLHPCSMNEWMEINNHGSAASSEVQRLTSDVRSVTSMYLPLECPIIVSIALSQGIPSVRKPFRGNFVKSCLTLSGVLSTRRNTLCRPPDSQSGDEYYPAQVRCMIQADLQPMS